MKQLNYKETVSNLRGLMKDYIIKSNLKSLVLGISGGIDSALVAVLVKPVCDELGIPLIGRSITIGTNSDEEISRAKAIGDLFCNDFTEINLSEEFQILSNFDDMEGDSVKASVAYKIRMGNIKARMRMTYLYNLASKSDGLVLSTDNMTELLLGFWSLHGDVGDYGLIQELWKTEVYDMSEWLSVNELDTKRKSDALMSCVTGDATDGLGITSTDLDQILPDWKNRHTTTRTGYSEVDEILISYIDNVEKLTNNSNRNFSEINELAEKVMATKEHPVIVRHMNSQFKRENPFNEKRENYVKY